jgi:hypothetical protein
MNFFKCTLLLVTLVLVSACFGLNAIHGSGNIKTEPRTVSGFDRVEVSGNAKLIVEQGETESLTITADDNLLEYLTSNVEGSKLILGVKSGSSLQPTAPITYKLVVRKLNAIGASGSITVDAKDIQTDSLTVAVSGSGEVSISGNANEQKIAISGSANYKAESFNTKETSISISGSGKAVLAASSRLDVEVSGAGEVRYIGEPKITKNISGSGIVEPWSK